MLLEIKDETVTLDDDVIESFLLGGGGTGTGTGTVLCELEEEDDDDEEEGSDGGEG